MLFSFILPFLNPLFSHLLFFSKKLAPGTPQYLWEMEQDRFILVGEKKSYIVFLHMHFKKILCTHGFQISKFHYHEPLEVLL